MNAMPVFVVKDCPEQLTILGQTSSMVTTVEHHAWSAAARHECLAELGSPPEHVGVRPEVERPHCWLAGSLSPESL